MNTNGNMVTKLFLFQIPKINAKLLTNYVTLSNKNRKFSKALFKHHISQKGEEFKEDLTKEKNSFNGDVRVKF